MLLPDLWPAYYAHAKGIEVTDLGNYDQTNQHMSIAKLNFYFICVI